MAVKIRTILLLLFAQLAFLNVVCDENPQIIPLSKEDFAIGTSGNYFQLNQDINSMITYLGEPQSHQINKHKNNSKWDIHVLIYENIEFTYSEGWNELRTFNIFSDSLLQTKRGIQIGNTIEEVKTAYKGTLFSKYDNRLITYYEWFDDLGLIGTEYYLSFSHTDGVVTEIEIGIAIN